MIRCKTSKLGAKTDTKERQRGESCVTFVASADILGRHNPD